MFDHPRLDEVKIKCQEYKGTTVLMRVFQGTINLLPLMILSIMICVARSLISRWFLLFWPFNDIEMTKKLAVNYEYSFFLSIVLYFSHNYQKLFLLVVLKLPVIVQSKEWNKEERWEAKVSWSPKTASVSGKGQQKSVSLSIYLDFSFYFHQKSKTNIVVVQIDTHNLFEMFHRWPEEGGQNIGSRVFFPNCLLLGFY